MDFISGDYPHSNSIQAARYSSRFMSTQGIAWDLMAWSFSKQPNSSGWTQKSAVQLQREAACGLAKGGGFQAYYTQNRDGSFNLDKLESMQQTAQFCRQRQAVSFNSKAVPQVVMLCNTAAHYRRASQLNQGLFPWSIGWQRLMLDRLLENQYSVEIFTETNLLPVLKQYPLLFICEWDYYAPELLTAISDYVSSGGKLLLVGEAVAAPFSELLKGSTVICSSVDGLPLKRWEFGSGSVAILEANASSGKVPASAIRSGVESLNAEFLVRVQGCSTVDVSVRTAQDGRLVVHLVNTSGDHQSAGIVESIDPIGPLTVTIRTDKRPQRGSLVPGDQSLRWDFQAGVLKVLIDRIDIHEILVLE